MHFNNNSTYLPQNFLQKFPCKLLKYGNNVTQYVAFSIENVLPDSFLVENVHGNNVVYANSESQKADAHIIAGTNSEIKRLTQKYLAIKTADCLPVMFVYQDENYFIGGITHAGWKGLTSQIITNTIEKLKIEAARFKISPQQFINNLKVFIGPAIFGVAYECGEDVKEALHKYKLSLLNDYNSQLFNVCANVKIDPQLTKEIEQFAKIHDRNLQPNSIFPDLQLLAVLECVHSGVNCKNIAIFRENTYAHALLPSFREYCHKAKNGQNSRLWTHLVL